MTALDRIPPHEQEMYLREFCFKHKIDSKRLFSINYSISAVLNDLSILNEDAVNDTITEMKQNEHIEMVQNFCKWCEDASIGQINEEIEKLNASIAATQKQIRFATYYKHLKTDYKSKLINLNTLLMRISAGVFL